MTDLASLNVCPACSKSYKRPEHLRRHQLSHSTDRPYKCALCRSTFQRSDVLKRHLQTCDSPADDPVSSSEPPSKRLALSNSPLPYKPTTRFAKPQEQTFQPLDSTNQLQDPCETDAPSFDHIAGWLSCGLSNHDFDCQSESWQDFLNLNSGLQTPRTVPEDEDQHAVSLEFLANFTSNTGLVSSFDCGTLEQRQRVAANFSDTPGQHSTLAPSAATGTSESSVKTVSDGTTSDIDHEYCPQAVEHQWLSDPLSLKSHEIILAVKDFILHKSRNSCVTLSWSTTLQEACVRFFSPERLRRYLYFYWAIWHSNVNIMHKPSFNPSSSKPELVAAMSLIGACVSPEPSDLGDAKLWFSCVEEMVFSDDDLFEDSPAPVCRDTGEVLWRRGKLRALQAAYMVCLYQNWEGTNSSKRRIRRYRYSTVVAAARDTGISNARHPDYNQQSLCDFSFSSFAVTEELIRVFLWIFLLDTAFVIFNNLPPRMVIREMKLSTAKPEVCFQATTAEDCFNALRGKDHCDTAFDFASAFEMLYQTDIDETLSTALANLGPLNLFAMTSALHSLIFHFQSSFSCQGSLYPIRQAQKTWRQVWDIFLDLFSHDSRHSPVASAMQNLAPDDMWKRIGFTRYASEYWLLGKFMVERLSNRNEDDVATVEDPVGQVQSQAGFSGPDSAGQLLSQYDQTSMEQVNVLITDFQKVSIL